VPYQCSTASEAAARQLFDQLTVGDRVKLVHTVTVGNKQWTTTTTGTVERKERRRQGLHFRRNLDDKVFSDMLVLKRDSGDLTTVTMDEFTELKRI
jgi:hypothetical protein